MTRAVGLALARAGHTRAEVSLAIVDDEAIRRLNREYRHADRPTDVLSFALLEGDGDGDETAPPEAAPPEETVAGPVPPMWGPEEPLLLGDVVISLERARAQAEEYGHTLAREFCFLAVHGTLHLLGYDHDTPEAEAAMIAETEAILGEVRLGRAQ